MSETVDPSAPAGRLSPVEKLNSNHRVKAFKSGKHSLDLFLKRHAFKNQEAGSSQTYIVQRNGSVAGYYSLTVGSVDRHHCPPGITAGMPPDYPVPVILLARLAVDRREQGHGLGSALLKDAFYRIASAAEIVGARAVLVHAIDAQARAFYEHFNFEEFPSGTLHLMLSLKDVRAAIA
ncbi:MAG: GNAT family N-acetyltransferase [Acidobacteriia bacterium]|nr:GNAT family N-acetyltransferase [Terriglobia bacterium]